MKKICPYCNRTGELGEVCQGCGYILSAKDQTVPGTEPVNSQPGYSQTTYSQTIYTQTTLTEAPQAWAQSGQSNPQPAQAQTQSAYSQMQSPRTSALQSTFSRLTNHPVFIRLISIIGWMIAVFFFLIGITGFTMEVTTSGIGMSRTFYNLLSCLFISGGLMVLGLTQPKLKKFRKFIKYLLIVNFVLFILAVFFL